MTPKVSYAPQSWIHPLGTTTIYIPVICLICLSETKNILAIIFRSLFDMNRKTHIDTITRFQAIFLEEVKGFVALGTYDINIHAENAVIPILNLVFSIDLVNINAKRK